MHRVLGLVKAQGVQASPGPGVALCRQSYGGQEQRGGLAGLYWGCRTGGADALAVWGQKYSYLPWSNPHLPVWLQHCAGTRRVVTQNRAGDEKALLSQMVLG